MNTKTWFLTKMMMLMVDVVCGSFLHRNHPKNVGELQPGPGVAPQLGRRVREESGGGPRHPACGRRVQRSVRVPVGPAPPAAHPGTLRTQRPGDGGHVPRAGHVCDHQEGQRGPH